MTFSDHTPGRKLRGLLVFDVVSRRSATPTAWSWCEHRQQWLCGVLQRSGNARRAAELGQVLVLVSQATISPFCSVLFSQTSIFQ